MNVEIETKMEHLAITAQRQLRSAFGMAQQGFLWAAASQAAAAAWGAAQVGAVNIANEALELHELMIVKLTVKNRELLAKQRVARRALRRRGK